MTEPDGQGTCSHGRAPGLVDDLVVRVPRRRLGGRGRGWGRAACIALVLDLGLAWLARPTWT